MTVLETLIAAKAKIDRPEKWIKDFFARDQEGRNCLPVGDKRSIPVSFCARGALIAAEQTWEPEAEETLAESLGWFPYVEGKEEYIARWNNAPRRTHAQVMKAFDKAIKTARLQETS